MVSRIKIFCYFYYIEVFILSYHIFAYFLGMFTLRDMYEQFQNILKMGPFNQIMVIFAFSC